MTGKELGGRFRPYPRYRDSGIEWLGEVPEHWDVRRLKYVVPGVTVGIVVTPSKYYVDEGVPCLRSLNIAEGKVSTEDLVHISEAANEMHRKSMIFSGDLVVVRTGRAGTAAIVPDELDGTNCIDLLIIRRSAQIASKFLYYFLNSSTALGQVELSSVGAIQEHFNTKTLAELSVPCAPLEEQRAIAAFLDRETGKIDRAMGRLERLIELLEERRAAVIAHAVTRGLDPSVPLKDSGIEWLGQVPEHWLRTELKREFRILGGGTPSKDRPEYWEGTIPWVSPKDMKTSLVEDTEDHVTEEAIRETATQIVPEGSVLLVVRSGILRHTIPVALAGRQVAINQDLKALVPVGRIAASFLAYLVTGLQEVFLALWKKEGTTVESLELDLVRDTTIAIPPLDEQRAIAEYLDRETGEIDRAIGKAREEIELLREYRAALVTAAITGRIDVRSEAGEGSSAA